MKMKLFFILSTIVVGILIGGLLGPYAPLHSRERETLENDSAAPWFQKNLRSALGCTIDKNGHMLGMIIGGKMISQMAIGKDAPTQDHLSFYKSSAQWDFSDDTVFDIEYMDFSNVRPDNDNAEIVIYCQRYFRFDNPIAEDQP